jgi:hypothetical protein
MVSEYDIRTLLDELAASGEHGDLAELCRVALGKEDVSLREQQAAWDRIAAYLAERE